MLHIHKILVVDDQKSIHEDLRLYLDEREFRIFSATSGAQALDLIEKKEFDIILLNVTLPDIDGIAVLTRLKQQQPDVEIVIVTDKATLETARQALKYGVSMYEVKPAEVDNLAATIRQLAEKRALSIENSRLAELARRELRKRERAEEEQDDYRASIEPALDAVQDVFFFIDKNGRFLRWNTALNKVTHYSDAEIVKMGPLDFFVEEDRPFIQEAIEEIYTTGTAVVEARILSKNGDISFYDLSGTAVKDNSGRTVGLSGVGRDITRRMDAEENLRKSKNLLQGVFDAVDEAIFILDAEDRRIVSCNRAIKRIFGYEPGEIEGSSIGILHQSDESYESFRKDVFNALDRNGVFRGGYFLRRRDGSVFPSEHTVTELRDEEGTRTGVVSLIRDVSERFRAEEKLRRSEKSLAEAQRIAHIGNWDWDIRTSELFWSDEVFRIFGFSPQEFEITYDAFIERVYTEDVEHVKAAIDRALKGKEDYHIEHRILRDDGQLRHLEEHGEVIFDSESGEPVRMIGVVQDISEKKQVEEDRVRLVAAVESAEDAIVITGPQCTIHYVNPAWERLTGYAEDEVIGENIHRLPEESMHLEIEEEIHNTLAREGIWKGQLTSKNREGNSYLEDRTISPVYGNDGEIINYVHIIRNITDKKRLESIAEAVSSSNNIGQIFSGIRHEIGNPVNSCKMTLSMIQSNIEKYPKPAIQEYLQRVLEELGRVEFLLQSIKSYSMFERLTLKNIELSDFIEQFLSLVRTEQEHKGIRIETRMEQGIGCCTADPRALQQVMINLFSNASDACEGRQEAVISISVNSEGDNVRICIRDNGCGMTEEEMKYLFRPFYTTKKKGTGLGMVIARKLLAKMNGSLRMNSIKGKGSTAEVILPGGSIE